MNIYDEEYSTVKLMNRIAACGISSHQRKTIMDSVLGIKRIALNIVLWLFLFVSITLTGCGQDEPVEPIELLVTLQDEIINNILGRNIAGFTQESFNSATIGSLYQGDIVTVTDVDTTCIVDNISITDIGTISASETGVFSSSVNLNLLASTASVLASIEFSYNQIIEYTVLMRITDVEYQKINDLVKYESCAKLDNVSSYAYGAMTGILSFSLSAKDSQQESIEFDVGIIEGIQSEFDFDKDRSSNTVIEFVSKTPIVLGVAKKRL